MSDTTNTLRIWNQVCTTHPDHTKTIKKGGRRITAIDAQRQIHRATEVFGPIGHGWGYTADTRILDEPRWFVAEVTVWTESRDNTFGPVVGMCPLFVTLRNGNTIEDPDAGKKAITDALTKALAHLGFNADVFFGLFDDNRYVQQRRREEAGAHRQQEHRQQEPPGITSDQQAHLWRTAQEAGYTADGFRMLLAAHGYDRRSAVPASQFDAILALAADRTLADGHNRLSQEAPAADAA